MISQSTKDNLLEMVQPTLFLSSRLRSLAQLRWFTNDIIMRTSNSSHPSPMARTSGDWSGRRWLAANYTKNCTTTRIPRGILSIHTEAIENIFACLPGTSSPEKRGGKRTLWTLKEILRIYVRNDWKDWVRQLGKVEIACNTTMLPTLTCHRCIYTMDINRPIRWT